jgi:hypothetical protein
VNDVSQVKTKTVPVENQNLTLWRIGRVGGVVLYVISSLGFILFGRLNADEGFYLTASRLVMQGQLPYRDFAFTQMPLSAYLYGIPQSLFPPSILLGRATSVVLSIAVFSI